MIKTTDGGYALVGTTDSFGAGNDDIYVIKLDANGVIQWNETVGGSARDGAGSIIQTTDGGYAVAGWTGSFGGNSDIYIIKLDVNGVIQWASAVGGPLSGGPGSIVQTTDGGYVVAGTTFFLGPEGYDMFVLRLSSSGSALWCRALGGINYDGCNAMIRSEDGGYVMAGWGQPESGINDMYIVRLDSGGTLLWSERVGTTEDDWASSIIQTTDGGYVAAGSILEPNYGPGDYYVVKLNSVGTLLGSSAVGGPGDDYASSITHNAGSGYVVAGSTSSFGAGQSDFYIVEFDTNLNTCDNWTLPATQSAYEADTSTVTPTVVSTTPTVTTPTLTVRSGGTVTMICSVTSAEQELEIPREFSLSQNYPNPFNPKTEIGFRLPESGFTSLRVFDLLGREVGTLVNEMKAPGNYEVTFDASDLASGVYLYRLTAGSFSSVKKLVVVK